MNVNKILEILERDILQKEKELEQRKRYIQRSVRDDIDSDTFERNLMMDLLMTSELKAELKILKYQKEFLKQEALFVKDE